MAQILLSVLLMGRSLTKWVLKRLLKIKNREFLGQKNTENSIIFEINLHQCSNYYQYFFS